MPTSMPMWRGQYTYSTPRYMAFLASSRASSCGSGEGWVGGWLHIRLCRRAPVGGRGRAAQGGASGVGRGSQQGASRAPLWGCAGPAPEEGPGGAWQ